MKAAFGGYLGPKMKKRAKKWAKETPNKKKLPEHVSRRKRKAKKRKASTRKRRSRK